MAWRHDAIGVGRGSFIGPGLCSPVGGGKRERERHEAGGYGQSVEATSLAACHRPPPFLLTRQQASDSEENNLWELSQNARSSETGGDLRKLFLPDKIYSRVISNRHARRCR